MAGQLLTSLVEGLPASASAPQLPNCATHLVTSLLVVFLLCAGEVGTLTAQLEQLQGAHQELSNNQQQLQQEHDTVCEMRPPPPAAFRLVSVVLHTRQRCCAANPISQFGCLPAVLLHEDRCAPRSKKMSSSCPSCMRLSRH